MFNYGLHAPFLGSKCVRYRAGTPSLAGKSTTSLRTPKPKRPMHPHKVRYGKNVDSLYYTCTSTQDGFTASPCCGSFLSVLLLRWYGMVGQRRGGTSRAACSCGYARRRLLLQGGLVSRLLRHCCQQNYYCAGPPLPAYPTCFAFCLNITMRGFVVWCCVPGTVGPISSRSSICQHPGSLLLSTSRGRR